MKNAFLAISLLTTLLASSQKKQKLQIELSLPLIWNKTEVFDTYSGARTQYVEGTALSEGLKIGAILPLAKGINLYGGGGYFNQRFGINRPFDFAGDTTTNLQYNTEKYNYQNVQWSFGVGYNHPLNEVYTLSGRCTFNTWFTFRQKYLPDALSGYQSTDRQVTRQNRFFGNSVILNLGIIRPVTKKLLAGAGFLLPLYTTWRKDEIFRENAEEFYKPKLILGMNLFLRLPLK